MKDDYERQWGRNMNVHEDKFEEYKWMIPVRKGDYDVGDKRNEEEEVKDGNMMLVIIWMTMNT